MIRSIQTNWFSGKRNFKDTLSPADVLPAIDTMLHGYMHIYVPNLRRKITRLLLINTRNYLLDENAARDIVTVNG